MFVGRTQELKQLEDAYRQERNAAVVLYGRYGIGKTELAALLAKETTSPVLMFLNDEVVPFFLIEIVFVLSSSSRTMKDAGYSTT